MRKLRKIELLGKVESFCFGLLGVYFALAIILAVVALIPQSDALNDAILMMTDALIVNTIICAVVDCCCVIIESRLRSTLENLPQPLRRENAIRAHHGSSMAEAMEALRNERLEYEVACDVDGKVIAEGTMLSPHNCALVESDWYELPNKYVSLHNHPGLSELAFSSQDIKSLLYDKRCVSEIVVTPNFTYTLRWANSTRRSEIDAKEFYDHVDGVLDVDRTFLTCSTARRHYNRLISEIADRYGLVFTIENLRYERCRTWLVNNRRRVGVAAGCIAFVLNIFCNSAITTQDSVTVAVKEVARDAEVVSSIDTEIPNGHIELMDDEFQAVRPPKVAYAPYKGK